MVTIASKGCSPSRLRLLLLAVAASLTWIGGVAAQPAHYPGTVCYTPSFWCWAQPPGPAGSPCVCPAQNGFVPGVRG